MWDSSGEAGAAAVVCNITGPLSATDKAAVCTFVSGIWNVVAGLSGNRAALADLMCNMEQHCKKEKAVQGACSGARGDQDHTTSCQWCW
jgi:hypothetical protein